MYTHDKLYWTHITDIKEKFLYKKDIEKCVVSLFICYFMSQYEISVVYVQAVWRRGAIAVDI